MLTPDVGQGYLVLNKAEHPDVKTWVIEVNTRTFDQNNQPSEKTIDKVVLKNDINYWSVPEKVSESKDLRFIDVTGFDSNDNPVISEGPIVVSDHPETALEAGGTSMLPGCTWLCNGSYYAWEIQQYVNPDLPLAGPSRLVLETALNFNEALQESTPYYRYIAQSEYEQHCPNGIGEIAGISCSEPTGLWITPPFNVSVTDNGYPNADGVPLHGNSIRGVGKSLDVWEGQNPIGTPELQFGMNECGNPTWWAMDMVNNNAPTTYGYPINGTGNGYYPPLECNAPNGGSTVSGPEETDPCIEEAWDSFLNVPTQFPDDDDSIGDVWTPFVNAVLECLKEDDDEDGSVLSWQEAVDKIAIRNLNDPNQPPIIIDPDEPTTFTGGFTLVPGLYNFGFALKGTGYVPIILEVEKKFSISMAMADFLSVNIYPVPITDNKFNIDMTASEELKFTYEFRDGTGKLLYEEKFSLKKGQQWKHTVTPKEGIPSGNHINRFVFADGSILALQTIK